MKRILCFLIALLIMSSFPVVFGGAMEYSYDNMADFLNKMDILHGDASKGGSYDFESYLTRAQFSKLAIAGSVYKNSVPYGTNTSPYSDVTRNHWAAGYIKVASQNKIISGYPDSTFRPENNVLLEEAVTIVLKLLGYTNQDFGGEWPYGQMGIANSIGLLDNVSATVGQAMTRRDAIALIFNTMRADTKNGSEYLATLDYQIKEDAVLVSSHLQDSALSKDKVVTSEGTYKTNGGIDFTMVGMRGDLLLKNNKEAAGFFAEGKTRESYVVTGVLGKTVAVTGGGNVKSLDISDDTSAYYNNTQTTYSSVVSKITAGDGITVVRDNSGKIDYVTVTKQSMEGPYTVSSQNFLSTLPLELGSVSVIKGGGVAKESDIKINDILYYSKNLNTVWIYDGKRTGVYQEAIPNQEFPTSVVISGATYEIESAVALSKLNSQGSCKLGSAITVLLGKDGKIADVLISGMTSDEVYGYALSAGTKQYTVENETYSSYYIKIALPSGEESEYITDRLYENYRGKAVKLTFNNSVARVSEVSGGGASGIFNYSNLTFGKNKISKSIEIIDVKVTDLTSNGEYIKIYPARIDGVDIKDSEILYLEKNDNGEISKLILKDVTGDNYNYGIIISSEERGGTTYVTDGTEGRSGTYFTVGKRTPAKLDIRGGQLSGIKVLNSAGNIKTLTETYLTTEDGKKHYLYDSVNIYLINSNYDYMLMTLSDTLNDLSSYRINAYYDESSDKGGRIRVIILTKKDA